MSDFDKIRRIYYPAPISDNTFVIFAQRKNTETINEENNDGIFTFFIVNLYKK